MRVEQDSTSRRSPPVDRVNKIKMITFRKASRNKKNVKPKYDNILLTCSDVTKGRVPIERELYRVLLQGLSSMNQPYSKRIVGLLMVLFGIIQRSAFYPHTTINFNRVAIIVLLLSGVLAFHAMWVGQLGSGVVIFNGIFLLGVTAVFYTHSPN